MPHGAVAPANALEKRRLHENKERPRGRGLCSRGRERSSDACPVNDLLYIHRVLHERRTDKIIRTEPVHATDA
jgi:hypothetical protein